MQVRLFVRAACALAFTAVAARAETVVTSAKLGDNVEGATYAPNGRYQDSVLAMDGNDVIAIPLARAAKKIGKGDAAHPDNGNHYALGHLRNLKGDTYFKAFDVLGLPLEGRTPRGIVYSPVNQHFYFSSKMPNVGNLLYSTDDQGNALPPLNVPIQDLDTWSNWEGMTWIPAGAPKHANTIAALGQRRTNFISHVFYIRLDGTIEAEVVPTQNSTLTNYLCGITYRPNGTLLVTACSHDVYAMDLDGNALNAISHPTPDEDPASDPWVEVQPVVTTPDPDSVESLVFDSAGNFWATAYETATLRSFDASLQRQAAKDIPFSVGLGVSVGPLAYDFEHDQILTLTRAYRTLVAISPTLHSAARVLETTGHAEVQASHFFSYLAGGKVAIANTATTAPDGTFLPRGIAVLDTATDTVLSRSVFQASDEFPGGAPFASYGVAPWGNDFLVSVTGDAFNLKLVTATGDARPFPFPTGYRPARLPDLALSEEKGFPSVQVFGTGGATRINTGAKLFDASGMLVHAFDFGALNVTDPLSGSNATWIGGNRYAAVDGDTSTLIIFTVP